jgi:hypothetical protein
VILTGDIDDRGILKELHVSAKRNQRRLVRIEVASDLVIVKDSARRSCPVRLVGKI